MHWPDKDRIHTSEDWDCHYRVLTDSLLMKYNGAVQYCNLTYETTCTQQDSDFYGVMEP